MLNIDTYSQFRRPGNRTSSLIYDFYMLTCVTIRYQKAVDVLDRQILNRYLTLNSLTKHHCTAVAHYLGLRNKNHFNLIIVCLHDQVYLSSKMHFVAVCVKNEVITCVEQSP